MLLVPSKTPEIITTPSDPLAIFDWANPKTGKVLVVHFGDVSGGLSAKVSDSKARKSFAARHQCHLKKDKTKPGYWACRLNKFGHLFGGKTYPGYW